MEQKKESYKSGEKALTKKQVETLLANVTRLDDLVLLKLTIECGLRREDAVSILTKNISYIDKTLTFYEHKKKRFWTIPLSDNLLNTIKMWIDINRSHWLFPSRFKNSKSHLNSRSAYNILRKYTRQAKLPDIPFHALRSTCIKLHLKAGWSYEQISRLTGDKISTIQKHYSVPSIEEMKELAELKPIL